MKPSEIYAMDPVSVSTELYWPLDAHSHVPDVCLSDIPEGANTRVSVREIARYDFDDRRSWGLWSVWLDGCPVMIVRNAGREGRDYSARFITDEGAYTAMVHYLWEEAAPDRRVPL